MRLHTVREVLLFAGLAAGVAVTTPARAQTSSKDVAAEALFEDARTLVAAGNAADACPKFAESQRLSPSVATLLNLANCWEKLGRTATAWATYREAASAADAAGRKDYLATAQRRADSLSPRLARLTVTVPQPVAGLQLKRDGVAVDAAEWGVAIPVDTGAHPIEASAPGHKAWTTTVNVAQDASQSTVSVPPLEELPAEAPGAAPGPAVAPAQPSASAVPAPTTETSKVAVAPPQSGGGAQRAAGLVVGGLGVLGLAAGGILAGVAKGKYNDSLVNCDSTDKNSCNGTGVSQRNDARGLGDAATVALSVGGAAVVAGGILWFTAPHANGSTESTGASLQIAPTWGGILARGTW